MRARSLLPVLVPLSLLSCAGPQAAPPDSVPAPGEAAQRVVGTVRVVGSAPVNVQVVLQTAEGSTVRLTGPLRDELRRLAGAEVAVSGPLEPSPDPLAQRQVRVGGYEILAVDGAPVVAGIVEGRSGQWTTLRTAAGELVYLASAPEQLRPGQKVWVQGPRGVVVQTYGVLSPEQP